MQSVPDVKFDTKEALIKLSFEKPFEIITAFDSRESDYECYSSHVDFIKSHVTYGLVWLVTSVSWYKLINHSFFCISVETFPGAVAHPTWFLSRKTPSNARSSFPANSTNDLANSFEATQRYIRICSISVLQKKSSTNFRNVLHRKFCLIDKCRKTQFAIKKVNRHRSR